ncbi:MAG: universal stress protein [Asgard group archaeon]|nr:universal stress protein [Asgard group archaeon]
MATENDVLDLLLMGAPGDRILLPLLGYPSEKTAIFTALVIAEYFGCQISIYHITRKSMKTEKIFYEHIDWFRKEAERLNIQYEIVIKEEVAKKRTHMAIIHHIKELCPKLTIMMSRRKGLFQRLSGSIAERVARKSPYSVLIIRSPTKDWEITKDLPYPQKIVVPIGPGNPFEISALQLAIAIANAGQKKDAKIILLHVITIPETVPIIPEDDEMILQEEKAFIQKAGKFSTRLLFPMTSRVVVGRDIGRSVARFLNQEQASLAVLGVPYLPRKFFGLYGTDTSDILHISNCPVLMLFYKEFIKNACSDLNSKRETFNT